MSEKSLDKTPAESAKVLVFIVAYQAERHIEKVLERVPQQLWEDDRVHVLVIDDASKDASIDLARAWVSAKQKERVTLLKNPVNQGYGGNQKLGYRIAIEAGFDFVILLHGDGQYAPELLPRFIDEFRQSAADVVLGTRMADVKSAVAGGMPRYKVVGNTVLTWLQNKMTGRRLSEYHTGYRGYSTAFLKAVPFETNTNAFHFDTEILLQAFHIDAKLKEFAIPTHYGDEVCHVDGPRYALDVIKSTVQFRLHQMGMLCSLKYRNLSPLRYRDKTHHLYTSHRMAIGELEKICAKRGQKQATGLSILDLGCGPGFVAKGCQEKGHRVTGVDKYEPIAGTMSEFVKSDLETQKVPRDVFDYDAVLLLDVIEHLAEPESFLVSLRNDSKVVSSVREAPAVLISTPNIAFAAVRLNLLLGRFSYAERGILDITHKRLFTRRSLRRALEDCGYVIEKIRPVAVPFETVLEGKGAAAKVGRVLGWVCDVLARVWPTMFAFQFLVVCRPRPGARQLLMQSVKSMTTDTRVNSGIERVVNEPAEI